MNILDIAIAKKLAGGGGGSGTDNYNDLSNLPKINDTTLSGNKTSANLGLQSEINSDSKLASDLVDDSTSTNKFVTASDKETWNAKQNAIDNSHKLSSDLVDDADHTNKFVTSTEKQTWNAKQNAIDADHKLSSSLVSFSAAEAAALASGIDSTKVAQISTNQTNILLVQDATEELVDKGAKNIFDITTPDLLRDTVVTPLSNGEATLSCNNAAWTQYGKNVDVEVGKKYKVIVYIDSITGSVGTDFNVNISQGSTFLPITPTNTGEYSVEVESTATTLGVAIFINNSGTPKSLSINMRMMICTLVDWKVSQQYIPFALPNYDLTRMMTPFFTVPINHNMIYRGQNLGDTLTADQDTALSSGNFTDLYLGDYWTKQITIPAFYEVTAAEPADWSTNYTSYYTKSGDTYTPVTGDTAPTWAANTYYERLVPSQTVTLKAVIADFDTFYAGYASGYAAINSHHAAVVVTGFNNVVWNKTNTTAGGYVNSLIHKWLVGSALPQIEAWFGSAKVLSQQKMLTNAITGDAASEFAWSPQKISLLSENQTYGSKVWGGSYDTGEAFKHLNVFNHIDASLLFGNKNTWFRDITSAERASFLGGRGYASYYGTSSSSVVPAALILLS